MSKRSPTPAEIRSVRQASGLSQTAAAKLIYSTMRTWQDWEAGKSHMHPGLWELFLQKKPESCSDRMGGELK
ncbi:helix-turn-helix domain-containing protein [Herbaspirillum sp. RTI4]|uniref:helix-turn-helix domain-containing protein n=1 Tax=Herbaspirillum sp. RTI4 TaxID=3048640 RepID=UPI002B22F53C|nr:helix-turn-helix domain-containing protein [Herbaspirillum sp. RTI4]